MFLEDPYGNRIKKTQRPSEEEIERILALPYKELIPAVARFLLVPENPSRIAYSVLRQIFLTTVDDFWETTLEVLLEPMTNTEIGTSLSESKAAKKRVEEISLWFKPPEEPMSLETALRLAAGSKSKYWTESVMKQAGKHRRPGQPASKRHLALMALDIKCAYPDTSRREVTDILCPCGNEAHTDRCREQLRQQVLRLVKFLRQHGHDFTWEHIKSQGV